MDEQKQVIEVEVESSTVDEVKKDEPPVKMKGEYSRQINLFGRLSTFLLGFGFPAFFIFLTFGLIFSILFTNSEQEIYVILLRIGFIAAGVALLGMVLGFIFRLVMRSYKRKDPNFEDSVYSDGVY